MTSTLPAPAAVRAHLQRVAAQAPTITYQALANELQLSPPNTILQVTTLLEELMRADAKAHRPFIAALVVSKRPPYLPGRGFFQLAAELGRFSGVDEEAHAFHAQELLRAQRYWSTVG
jgi:hypothetical protein